MYHVRDLYQIFEHVQGPLAMRESVKVVVMEEKEDDTCATREPLLFNVDDLTASSTPTTASTASAIRATAADAPPPSAPYTPHPLARIHFGAFPFAITEEEEEEDKEVSDLGATSTAYAAYVEELIASKKADAAETSTCVGLLLERLTVAAATEVDWDTPLEPHLSGLVADASFMSQTLRLHVLVFGDELQRASHWICDAEAREAVLVSQLTDRARQVKTLCEELAVARYGNDAAVSAAAVASAEAMGDMNKTVKDTDKVAFATVMNVQDQTASLDTETDMDTDTESEKDSHDFAGINDVGDERDDIVDSGIVQLEIADGAT